MVATKRLNVELPFNQYEFLRKEAAARGETVSSLIRQLIEERRTSPAPIPGAPDLGDPFLQRQGAFDGPPDLAKTHDRYLYDQNAS